MFFLLHIRENASFLNFLWIFTDTNHVTTMWAQLMSPISTGIFSKSKHPQIQFKFSHRKHAVSCFENQADFV